MRRRDFITLVGGVTAWPLVVQAQQGLQTRRIGVLVPGLDTDAEMAARVAAFQNAMRGLGWSPGTNLRLTFDLVPVTIICVSGRRNWLGLRQTLFWQCRHQVLSRCRRSAAQFRLYSPR